MATRSAVGLILALVIALVAVAPGAARDPGDLSAAELCALFPQDQGFAFTQAPGLNKCEASRGDCDQSADDLATCVSGIILQMSSPQEARDKIPAPGDGAWEALSGLGESAVGACDPFWCEVRLHRDRFWLSVLVAPGLGLEAARELAAQVDGEIVRILAGGPEPEEPSQRPEDPSPRSEAPSPRPEDPPPDPGAEPSNAPGSSDVLVDVFFGTEGAEALEPEIRRVLDCGEHEYPDVLDCRGANDVHDTVDGILDRFFEGPETPTRREVDGITAYTTAVAFAAFTAKDGSPLFPSIRAAMPVIRKLSSPAAATRFVEMLAARDAAEWPERWPKQDQ